MCCFVPLPVCLIKSLINPRNVTKMKMTFGTWMRDTALVNDERIWVAEHFSGELATDDRWRVEAVCFQQLEVNILVMSSFRSRAEGVREHRRF